MRVFVSFFNQVKSFSALVSGADQALRQTGFGPQAHRLVAGQLGFVRVDPLVDNLGGALCGWRMVVFGV